MFKTVSKIATLFFMALAVFVFLGPEDAMAKDLTVKSDKTLTAKFNVYDKVVIEEGVTLTLADHEGEPVGLEIQKSLVLKKGAKIQGDGIIIFHRKATSSGMDFYYRYQGKNKVIPGGVSERLLQLQEAEDYRPEFYYDTKAKVYVLNAGFNGGDPFEVRMDEQEVDICLGEKHKLSLSGITKGVKWSSEDPSIAKVNKKGRVKAVASGDVTIKATYKGKEYTCVVHCVEKGLSSKEMYLHAGENFFLKLYGTKVKSVKSSNKAIAKMDKKLKITAIAPGDCTLTVKGKNGEKYTCVVHVE